MSEDSSIFRDEVVYCLGVMTFDDIIEKRREPERVVPSGQQFLVFADSLVMNFVGKLSNSGCNLALDGNIG